MREPPSANARDEFLPKSVIALRAYSVEKFLHDLVAGLTVGLVALPLAMAFAISSGVPPEAGLYSAVVAGFLISALGGSMCQIGGPTGAFVVVVAGIVQRNGIDGLFTCTLMAGVVLVALGLTGLGSAVKYIPRPVVIGFTNGIAVLIASTEIKDFFGLHIASSPGDLVGRVHAAAENWGSLNQVATTMSVVSLAIIVLLSRFVRRIPGAIVALVLATAAAWIFKLPIETIESRFGGVPSGLPHFRWPSFRPELVPTLLGPALTVAMLGAIESLLSAVVADRMSGDRHNPNVELFAQGIANLAAPLFGGIPATGAIARTATNIRAGAKTPVAGMLHAVTLLAILLFAAPLAKHIPLSVLAAILMVVAYNMGEWSEIPAILKLGPADVAVWIITFLLTAFADLTVAVEAGMILAALLYIHRVTSTTSVSRVTEEYIRDGYAHSLQQNEIPQGAAVYRIHGPLLFGSTDKLAAIRDDLPNLPPVVLLRLRNMNAIDGTGVSALEDLADEVHASGRALLVCGIRDQPAKILSRADFHERIGEENILANLSDAVERANKLLANRSALHRALEASAGHSK
jgi:SulP family sulfate permease